MDSPNFSRNITVCGTIAGVVVASMLYRRYRNLEVRKSYPQDVVILHQFPRGIRAPSASPFALKLETWLRMTDIKYQNDFGYSTSSKSAIPWITYNNVDVADSQFIIEYLSQKLNKDLNEHLNDQEKAVSRAVFKMTEESLKWAFVLRRFVYNPDPKEAGIPRIVSFLFSGKVKKVGYAQGYGRHNEEEVYAIAKADLKSLNDIIGENKFVMGDRVSEVDATVFGHCAQYLYHDLGPVHVYLKNNCQNVVRFIETMKQIYWPDWDSNIKK